MNTKADFRHQSWKPLNGLRPAQRIITTKRGLAAFLVICLGFAARAQDFQNLDFEAARLIRNRSRVSRHRLST